ncbi:hypothetical protein CR513_20995, partial [Mucuna pruriens]
MAPFEALYGRRCRIPMCWYQGGEHLLVRPNLKILSKIPWTLPNLTSSQPHSLPNSLTSLFVKHTKYFPCVLVEKVFQKTSHISYSLTRYKYERICPMRLNQQGLRIGE